MACKAYMVKRFDPESARLIDAAIEILERLGVQMTVRQLYYQLVASDLIPNSAKSYKRVVRVVRDGRLAGLIDWDHIEDRLRVPRVPSTWDDAGSFMRDVRHAFHLDRWEGQDQRVEVWVEKDALAGICGDVARAWQVTMQVNRGYSSVSAMREAAERVRRFNREGIAVTIGYLGDHDPSGEDMVRDVRDRLAMFGATVEVVKLAILESDIARYDLPPQPVKDTDARADAFRAKHGEACVELDALRPDVLSDRIQDFITERLDALEWQARVHEEDRQRERLIPKGKRAKV